MKALIVLFSICLIFTASANAQIESVPAATPVALPALPAIDTRANAHDTLANDPSITSLELPRVVPQRNLAMGGIGKLLIGGMLIEWVEESFHRYHHILEKHPDWFDVLKIHQDRYEPKLENGPALVNAAYEFQGISDKKFGYCWGFSTLLRNFLTLAFYDPTLPKLENNQDYEKLIIEIGNGKATVIPGFSNLREFTMVPEIELSMKVNAMKLWRRMAIRTSSVGLYLRTTNEMEFPEEIALVDKLEEKLKRGELPKIVFSSKVTASGVVKLSKYIHVVLVNEVIRMPDGGAKIKVWDVNFYAESLAQSPKYLEITPDGKIRYEPWYEAGTDYAEDSRYISRIAISPENDRETARSIVQLRRFCSDLDHASFCGPKL
jgi:hypothetical protein